MSSFDLAKVIPEWINQSFFEKVVRHMEKDATARVFSFEIGPGGKPGENFASALFRAKVIYVSKYAKSEKTISLIIKAKPVLGPEMAIFAEIHEKSPFFPTEMSMYRNILPQIQSLLSAAGDNEMLSPKLIYQSNEPAPVIVLEDLTQYEYATIDAVPENFEDTKKVFKRLAKFHAGSFYLANVNKEDFSDFNYSFYKDNDMMLMLNERSLHGFANVMREWGGVFESFAPAMDKFASTFASRALASYTPNRSEHGFNVLNHGDFHIRNLLFKQQDGKIDDVKFIDFQLCNYASPAIDLIYALYNFASPENRQCNRRNELIAFYHSNFVEALKSFGYMKAPPSLLDLHIELLKNGHLEVLMLVIAQTIFYIDLSKFKPEDFADEELCMKMNREIYNIPAFKEILMGELPRFFHCGFV